MIARFLSPTIALLLIFPPAALATDEESPSPSPEVSGPIATIPVNPDDLRALIIVDPELSDVQVAPGETLILRGRLAAGAPPGRTVIAIADVGELEGDVDVGLDGSIEHMITVPGDLSAGRYELVLLTEDLGVSPLGTITVESLSGAEGTDRAPGTEGPETVRAPATTPLEPASSEEGGSSSPWWLAGLTVLLIGLGALWLLRRRRSRSRDRTRQHSTLPTSGPVLGRPRPDVSNGPAVTRTPAASEAQGSKAAYVLVELVVDPGREDEDHEEVVLGRFEDADTAKAAARDARRGRRPSSEEVWWEIRPPGHRAVWMIHAWAAKEYDLS